MNPQELQLELQNKGVVFGPMELTMPEDTTMQDWAAVGRKLCRTDQVLKWWLGDWAAFGLRKYGQLKEFAEANNINYGSLRNAAYVSQAVELSRRRDNVEWSKHAEVASLTPKEQSQWLNKAETDNLPISELRRQLRKSQGTHNALESDGPVVRFVSKALDELRAFLQGRPKEFWTPEIKSVWRTRLEWVVKFYDSLA